MKFYILLIYFAGVAICSQTNANIDELNTAVKLWVSKFIFCCGISDLNWPPPSSHENQRLKLSYPVSWDKRNCEQNANMLSIARKTVERGRERKCDNMRCLPHSIVIVNTIYIVLYLENGSLHKNARLYVVDKVNIWKLPTTIM